MISYRIDYSDAALMDLESIYLYYLLFTNDLYQSHDITNNIRKQIEALSIYPFRNPVIDFSNEQKREYRGLIIDRHIVIYYVDVMGLSIKIIRIMHQRQMK